MRARESAMVAYLSWKINTGLIVFVVERNFYRRMTHHIALEILVSEFYRANDER